MKGGKRVFTENIEEAETRLRRLAKLSGGASRLLSRVGLPGVDMWGSLVRFGG